MVRLEIATAAPFADFRQRFERAAPAFDWAAMEAIHSQGGSWDDVRAAVAANAPNGLMVYSSTEATALMGAAGHHNPVVHYLLGNHVVAEQMYRFDPLTLLYAPLRVLLICDTNGEAIVALDQPSTVFAGLNDPRTASVGDLLDEKVAALLCVIGVEVASTFIDVE